MSDRMLARGRRSARAGVALLAGLVAIGAGAGCAAGAGGAGGAGAAATRPALPTRLSDAEFWRLVTDVSEPGGFFRIVDNFTSNEMEVGLLATTLRERGIAGGVYVGVGPEQNFTYVSAIRPRLAFVVDIRRQAVVQHLMFKALFELAPDRAEFVSLLFSRPRPAGAGLDAATPVARLWEAFEAVPADSALAAATHARIVERLVRGHGFPLDSAERRQLAAVFDAFRRYGPAITTQGGRGGRGGGRGFADLTGASLDAAGRPQSFLATEDDYRFVRSLQERNLVVPVSGDFAGPRAIRAIGAYVRQHGATVRAFYVSNVEQYLFMDGRQGAFYENVAALPLDSGSVFIRPYSLRRGYGFRSPGGVGTPGVAVPADAAVRPLCPIVPFLRAAVEGRVTSNEAALACGP